MKQFGMLTGFEFRKIWKQRSSWVTLGIMLLLVVFVSSSILMGSSSVTVQSGESFGEGGSPEESGGGREVSFSESNAQKIRIGRENGRSLSGRVMDDALWDEVRQYYESGVVQKYQYSIQEEERKEARRYEDVYRIFREFGILFRDEVREKTAAELYQGRKDYQAVFYREYGMSEGEQDYWEKQGEAIETPMVYEYSEGWRAFLSRDAYMIGMLVIFLTAICVTGIFTKEHSRKTDQLILCTRFGRKELYFAKICSGSLFSVICGFLFLGLSVLCNVLIYGPDGFGAPIQQAIAQYGLPLTMGAMVGITAMLLFFLSLLSGIAAMVLAEILKNGVATLAVLIGATLLIRMIPIPVSWRALSQLWGCLPPNLLYMENLFDLRLFSLFGVRLTFWQFAPGAYLLVSVLLVLLGKRVYCRYQVSGR